MRSFPPPKAGKLPATRDRDARHDAMQWILVPHQWTLSAQIGGVAIVLLSAMLIFAPRHAFFGEMSLKDRLLVIAAGLAALACALNWHTDGGA